MVAWHAWLERADDGLEFIELDRCDRGTITGRADIDDLESPHERRDGAVIYEGIGARTGVLRYRTQGGKVRRELVTLDTLRSMIATSMFSFVSEEHPKKNGKAIDVTKDNAKSLSAGSVGGAADVTLVETGNGEGYLKIRFVVHDPSVIKQIDDKILVELSPKYRTRYLPSPGVHPVHGAFDGVQESRDVNAFALTRKGRGAAVFVRADSAYQENDMTPEQIAALVKSTVKALLEERADNAATPAATPISDALVAQIAEKVSAALMPALAAGGATPATPATPAVPAGGDNADNVTLSKADFDAMKDKADKFEASQTEPTEDEAKAAEEKADSAFLDGFNERNRILGAAKARGVKLVDDDAKLGNAKLLAKVTKAVVGEDMHERADSDPGFCAGVLFATEAKDTRYTGLGKVKTPNKPVEGERDDSAGSGDPWRDGLQERINAQNASK